MSNPTIFIPGPLPARGKLVTFTTPDGEEVTGLVYIVGPGYVSVVVGEIKELAGRVTEITDAREFILREKGEEKGDGQEKVARANRKRVRKGRVGIGPCSSHSGPGDLAGG